MDGDNDKVKPEDLPTWEEIEEMTKLMIFGTDKKDEQEDRETEET